ncbi:MAG: DUF4012 domain-containing protein [Acidimicrobiales bacterium]
MAAITLTSALTAAVFTDGQATELWLIDAAYRGIFTAGLCWIGSRARRRTWPLLAAAAVICSSNWLLLAAAVGAAAVTATSIRGPRRRSVGALVGGITAIVLLSMDLPGPRLMETVVALLVIAPAAVSAWVVLDDTTTRRLRKAAAAITLAAVLAVLGAVITVFVAAGDLRSGVTASQEGLQAVRDGNVAAARGRLDQASSDLGRASSWLTSPLAQPARLVPVAGQHVRAAQVTTAEATALAGAAADAAAAVDTDRLRPVEGTIELAAFDPAVAPLERLNLTVQRAITNLAAIESPWLLAPAAGPLDELRQGLDDIAPAAEVAAVAARELPMLLGRDTPRHYLVLLTTPAEARGMGGFIGSWVMVTAADGRVELTETGRAGDINRALVQAEAELVAPDDYVARWGRFDPAGHFQDITFSPDFPTVAAVAAGLVRQTGRPVDGVLAVDPIGLEALLAFTGPIDVPGADRPLTEHNAADYLLREQYDAFEDNDEREAMLAETAGALFEQLLAADFPSLGAVRDVLGPAVAADRVVAWTDRPASFFTVSGLDGAFPAADTTTGDFLAVAHQNSAQNKIDVFLDRSIRYRATVDPDTGELVATVTVSLTNGAPARGLPPSVIGSNDQGLPLGTNRQYLSVYSPHLIAGARVDGETHLMETNLELGWQTYSTYLEIGPGETVELEIDLIGQVADPAAYQLTIAPQPLAEPDHITVDVGGIGEPIVAADLRTDRLTIVKS